MEQKEKVLKVLELVVNTIGADYKTQSDCRKSLVNMLNEVNELRSELESKDEYYNQRTLLGSIIKS